jgi:hypothetical protein
VVVDETGELLCGHARVSAARRLKIQSIPAVRACHLSEAQKRAFVLADNRLAELASWNAKSLKRELQFLSELDIDYDFLALGFDTAEIDFILGDGDEGDDRTNAVRKRLIRQFPDPAIFGSSRRRRTARFHTATHHRSDRGESAPYPASAREHVTVTAAIHILSPRPIVSNRSDCPAHVASCSSNALASFKSSVSKPSVNQP